MQQFVVIVAIHPSSQGKAGYGVIRKETWDCWRKGDIRLGKDAIATERSFINLMTIVFFFILIMFGVYLIFFP